MNNFDEQIYQIVSSIPLGKVTTYGQIAKLLGNIHFARKVGKALHKNPYKGVVPCHRVVFSNGELSSSFAFGGKENQKKLLENEGVDFLEDYKVDKKCFFSFLID